MKKRLISLVLCLILVAAAVVVLAACKKDGNYDYEIVVWVGEGTKDLTLKQIEEFNKTSDKTFKATVEIVSESVAVGDASKKPADCADIFCFAQDQLASAVQFKLLSSLNTEAKTFVEDNFDEDTIEAATIGSQIRAFPMTADNGFFLYYDKNELTATDVQTIEGIVDVCKRTGKNFSFNLTKDGGWYASSFFYATGCHSNWIVNEDGRFVNMDDTFNSEAGLIAAKGMKKVLDLGDRYQERDKAVDFSAGTPSIAVVSGIWEYETAKQKLGSNLGIAPLPSFTVDGQSYQLKSFIGHKFMGVKPQEDAYKAYYLQKLAMYLTGKECQKQRFEEVSWGPAEKTLRADPSIVSEALTALRQSATLPQGQYPQNWWSYMDDLTTGIKGAASDTVIRDILGDYADNIRKVLAN